MSLAGTDVVEMPRVTAVMSVPRLGFMDNFFCALSVLPKFGIGVRKTTGAFWGQCLERAIEQALAEDPEWILTIDYDSVFTAEQLEMLMALAASRPDIDALAPIQVGRSKNEPLFVIRGEDGRPRGMVGRETFDAPAVRAASAHFGLTLLRVAKVRQLPKPWFRGVPDEEGRWGDKRIDDDVFFWKAWEAAGNSLFIASRIAIGHAELVVRWPDVNFEVIHQHPSEFWSKGLPEALWR